MLYFLKEVTSTSHVNIVFFLLSDANVQVANSKNSCVEKFEVVLVGSNHLEKQVI